VFLIIGYVELTNGMFTLFEACMCGAVAVACLAFERISRYLFWISFGESSVKGHKLVQTKLGELFDENVEEQEVEQPRPQPKPKPQIPIVPVDKKKRGYTEPAPIDEEFKNWKKKRSRM
jgi:hypothetical protein